MFRGAGKKSPSSAPPGRREKSVLLIIEECTKEEYVKLIPPELGPVFKQQEPIQILISSKESAVFMGILGIYKCTFTHKLGITKEQLAGKVLPHLIPLSIENSLNQFNSFICIIKETLNRLESEHQTKLEQFHIMQEQQKSLDIGNQMNVSGETKVTNILNQQIDKVVNHIGADLLTGSDSENKEDGLQNKRKTASLTFEEKQKLAKEQEQAQKLKSQQPLKPQVHTPIAIVKQTNDLTDTLMDNMSSLTSLSVSTPKPSASSTFTSLPSMGIGMMFSIPVDNTKKNLTNGLNANMGFQTSGFNMPVTTNQNFYNVCSNEDLPEVELVSLLEEQLPQYRLKVDTLFLYENQDWTQSPHQRQHASDALSPVLAEETFRYMILGTDRVEQMTKTYNDIDMVTHLLAERDRDLELAARIGQALLKRNHVLSEQNESLEEQLGQAFDQVNQLQHELSKKDELLRIVSIASEESETDSSCSTPLRFNESFSLSQGLLQLEMLQEKLKELEEENMALRSKACHIKTETVTYEEKEQQLVSDCVKELRETNAQMSRMTEELSGKSDELIRYQEEISSLLSQIVDLQHKLKEHVIEKEELKLHLQASKDAQRQLTMELHELQDRNMECLGMLHESQEEIKELRSRSGPAAHLYFSQTYGAFTGESLAAEIEGTMRKKLSLDEESSLFKQKAQQKRVFDTVRIANDTRGRSISFPALLPIPGSNRSSVIMTAKPFESGLQQTEDKSLLNQGSSSEEVAGSSQNMGQPGPSGDSDLATALHRLNLRRQNYLSEKQFFAEEWQRKIQVLADQKEGVSGCVTPTDSLVSLCTNQSEITDLSSASCLRGFMPEKLQIVKPLE
ncbi:hypothetical protein H8959_000125, partial [Pygathrix nigripes]